MFDVHIMTNRPCGSGKFYILNFISSPLIRSMFIYITGS